jgi:O-methyltransferase/IclR-like helix-turn-helix domain-containing protein
MSEPAPETHLWDLMRGAMGTKALAIAADLRLSDALAAGPRPVTELAQATGSSPSTLHRILRALASDGVFAEDEPGVFRNTDASDLLRRESWAEFAHLFGSIFTEATNTLDPTVSDETFTEQFGTDFWSWLEAHPDERRSFDAAMAGGKEDSAEQLAELDWRPDETVIDIGGGNGALLRELTRLRPELRGIVFDLPETVRDEADFGDRIAFVAGSFFESVPAGDAYVLSRILHDWSDERAGAILRTIRDAARPGARLLLIENVVADGNEPDGSKWLDLLMLVLGGRERTEEEWRALLDGAGFVAHDVEDGLIQATCR